MITNPLKNIINKKIVYKYSHRKLDKMFADKILRFIFKHYSESGAVEEMLDKDETLSRNKEGYRKWVEVFIKSFEIWEYSQMNKKKVYKKKRRSSSY